MSIRSKIATVFFAVLACAAIAQTEKVTKRWTSFYHGVNTDVRSPDGTAAIRCRTPMLPDKDGDDTPRIYAIRGKRSLYLGRVVRSGVVFCRPDSKLAVFNDDQGSNYAEFRIIRVDPELKDIRSAYKLVHARWRSEFKAGEILHDYTRGEGWLNETDLLISVYADGMPPGKREGSGIGFCRGYVLDTDTITIKREVTRQELRQNFKLKLCW